MNKKRQKKLLHLTLMLTGVGMSISLALYALRQNISLYYTPTQLSQLTLSSGALIRIGGVVADHSVHYFGKSHYVEFSVADQHQAITVTYNGLLPALFRVGQGVVVQGYLQSNGIFLADQVLAKHGSNYHA